MLAEAALGTPAEAGPPQTADEEEIEDAPSSPADILAEAVVEHEEPEPPVTGNIEEPTKAEAEAGFEAVESIAEAAFDQPVETAEEETAETALVEGAVGESPANSPEAAETSAGEGKQQESAPTAAEHTAAEADSPQLPPKAAPTPPQATQAAAAPHQAVKREEGPDTSPVSVLVSQVYEGPLDLLLDLIRKQDIDIYDIPIAKITAQFLAYVDQLKASDMDVAGEFIYTASLLIHIKSKMLLPRAPAGPDDVQEDPRRELVERLLEHERFKNAAQMLQQKQMLESATWTNPGMREFRDDANADAEIAADTTDLVRIFREILERARNRPILNLQEDSVTVGQMIQFLTRRLTMEDKPVALRRLLSQTRSERALIAMFLALLELVRLQAILLRQDRQFSEIFIKKNSRFEAFMNQGAARDDWQ